MAAAKAFGANFGELRLLTPICAFFSGKKRLFIFMAGGLGL
jgi:hypothetical protein